MDEDNDDRFPDNSPVEVRYPRSPGKAHLPRPHPRHLPAATVTELLSHASRAASGPVIRRSSGKLEAMIAREAARPAATMM